MTKEDTLSRILEEQKRTNETLAREEQARKDAQLAEEYLRPIQERLEHYRAEHKKQPSGVYISAIEKTRRELHNEKEDVKTGAFRTRIHDDTPAGKVTSMERQIEALRTEENELAVHLTRYPNDTDIFGRKAVVSRQRKILEVDLAKYKRDNSLD
jgi:ribosomal protein S15P/S13E